MKYSLYWKVQKKVWKELFSSKTYFFFLVLSFLLLQKILLLLLQLLYSINRRIALPKTVIPFVSLDTIHLHTIFAIMKWSVLTTFRTFRMYVLVPILCIRNAILNGEFSASLAAEKLAGRRGGGGIVVPIPTALGSVTCIR
jgi:hypothetical protein